MIGVGGRRLSMPGPEAGHLSNSSERDYLGADLKGAASSNKQPNRVRRVALRSQKLIRACSVNTRFSRAYTPAVANVSRFQNAENVSLRRSPTRVSTLARPLNELTPEVHRETFPRLVGGGVAPPSFSACSAFLAK
jgi:hypothetical protein